MSPPRVDEIRIVRRGMGLAEPAGMKRGLVVIVLAACSSPASMPHSPGDSKGVRTGDDTVDVVVGVDETSFTRHVRARFAGLSIETSDLCHVLALDASSDALAAVYRNIGGATLRIGGNSGDRASWSPSGAASCGASTTLSSALVDEVVGFAKRVDWNLVWTVDLGANDPAAAHDEAQYIYAAGVTSTGGNVVDAVAIGNEPDLYARNGLRPTTYAYADYKVEWEAYAAALANVGPPLVGDDDCCHDTWFASFVTDEHVQLSAASHHLYPTSATGTGDRVPTIENLLGASLMDASVARIQTWVADAAPYGLPVEISETNSTSGGGTTGVSDTFAAALWGADYLFRGLELGVRKMNFHGAGHARYSPIDYNGNPTPLYYALLLFRAAAPVGGGILTPTTQGSASVAAHAIIGADGALYVTLVNKDVAAHAAVTIRVATTYATASAVRLEAPAVDATTGITFAGAAVGADGTWTPAAATPIAVDGGQLLITVPAASATVVTLSP
jgi:hypothetical protein